MTQSTTVLVVAHPDGHLEAFAERGVQVKFAELPVVSTVEAERLAEDLLTESLPLRYRDLYWPGQVVATHTMSRPSAADLQQIAVKLDLLHAIEQISQPAPARPSAKIAKANAHAIAHRIRQARRAQ